MRTEVKSFGLQNEKKKIQGAARWSILRNSAEKEIGGYLTQMIDVLKPLHTTKILGPWENSSALKKWMGSQNKTFNCCSTCERNCVLGKRLSFHSMAMSGIHTYASWCKESEEQGNLSFSMNENKKLVENVPRGSCKKWKKEIAREKQNFWKTEICIECSFTVVIEVTDLNEGAQRSEGVPEMK